jgi:peptidoglycan/LPS O-acetylase OafA/YrhL
LSCSQRPLGNLASIDAARGLAALAVAMFHGYIWILAPWGPTVFSHGTAQFSYHLHRLIPDGWAELLYPFFGLGFLGVNLFFVLSGFCIHLPHAHKRLQSLNLPNFFLRRLTRIYPLYTFMCILLFVVYGPITGEYAAKGVQWPNIIGHMFFWHYLGPSNAAGMGISLVMWTLALEVQFYLIYGLLYHRFRRIGIGKITIAWVLVDLAYHLIWPFLPPEFTALGALSPARFAFFRFGEWLLGAWLAEAFLSHRLPAKPAPTIAAGTLIIAGSVVIGSVLGADKYASTDVPGCVGFAFILAALLRLEQCGRFERHRALSWLGDRSYSLYLVHGSVLLFISKVASKHISASVLGGVLIPIGFFLIAMLVSLAFAAIAYRLIEAPSHRLARRLRDDAAGQSPAHPDEAVRA